MADAPRTVPPEVIDALKRGDKQGAMKMLLKGRQVTGIKDVMQLLQTLQESGVLKEVKQQVNVNISTARSDALPAGVIDALRKGNKIEAIKRLREATGAGLVEAKGTIESFEAAEGRAAPATPHPAPHPHPKPVTSVPLSRDGLSPGEVPRSNGKAMAFIVLFVVAAVAVFLILR